MPTNTRMESCLAEERGAMVFWSPDVQQRKPGSKVQIIDVFSLQVVTGYTRDPQGRLLLESQPSVAAGRSWSLAKAAQLMCNDARPHRWVELCSSTSRPGGCSGLVAGSSAAVGCYPSRSLHRKFPAHSLRQPQKRCCNWFWILALISPALFRALLQKLPTITRDPGGSSLGHHWPWLNWKRPSWQRNATRQRWLPRPMPPAG